MGKKLDALLGKRFNTSKFTSLVGLAIARLAVFKNQRQVRCNQARSDVVQLLEQGHHDRALLRVEHMIKEQNVLDVYVMMEGYCNVLIERVHLIEQEKECPDELKEAISTLLYGSTRCGDFPELQEIRAVFVSQYGKEFAARAMELRNNCGVNPAMIQKLSTRQPNFDSRMRVLKEIASGNNIILQLGEASSSIAEEKLEANKVQNQPMPQESTNLGKGKLVDDLLISSEDSGKDSFSDAMKTRKKYKDVADAAQAAFESAAYAAVAARAAVELSHSNSHDPDNQNSPKHRERRASVKSDPTEHVDGSKNEEVHHENEAAKLKDKGIAELIPSASSSSLVDVGLKVATISSDAEGITKNSEKDVVFDESGDENHDLGSNIKPDKLISEVLETEDSTQQIPAVIQAGVKVESGDGSSTVHDAEGSGNIFSQLFGRKRRLFSARTRQVRGY